MKIDREIISVAPMVGITNRHFRYLCRLFSKYVYLYSEMVNVNAILHGNVANALNYNSVEHPVILQLAGSNPMQLQECTKIGVAYGYDEVNLNIGCPSPRVQAGGFGACLMNDPDLVARCANAMAETGAVISIKMRLGIGEVSYAALVDATKLYFNSGVKKIIIHARSAYLGAMNPKQNRSIPKLDYESVYRLKRDYAKHEIILNGGITDLQQAAEHIHHVDGVMLGRVVAQNPSLLSKVDELFYASNISPKPLLEVLDDYLVYVEQQLTAGEKLSYLLKPLFGFFHGRPGAREWRLFISQNMQGNLSGIDSIRKSLQKWF